MLVRTSPNTAQIDVLFGQALLHRLQSLRAKSVPLHMHQHCGTSPGVTYYVGDDLSARLALPIVGVDAPQPDAHAVAIVILYGRIGFFDRAVDGAIRRPTVV